MIWVLLGFYIGGALSEGFGLFLTFREVVRARRRQVAYRRRPVNLNVHDAAHAVESQEVPLTQAPPQSNEERIAALESRLDAVRDDLQAREKRIMATVEARTARSIEATAQRAEHVQQQLEEYVLDDDRVLQRRVFIGPVLLGFGLILGAVGNVLSLWA